jgi:hypothetical protein
VRGDQRGRGRVSGVAGRSARLCEMRSCLCLAREPNDAVPPAAKTDVGAPKACPVPTSTRKRPPPRVALTCSFSEAEEAVGLGCYVSYFENNTRARPTVILLD